MSSPHPSVLPPKAELPADLKIELWKGIDRRLRGGEVLITNEQFYQAMRREFRRQVRLKPDPGVKRALLEMIIATNDARPETYLTLGIKNAISRFFAEAADRAQGSADIKDEMTEMIRRMIKEGRTAFFLESIGVEMGNAELSSAIEASILSIVEGKTLRARPRKAQSLRRRTFAPAMAPVSVGLSRDGEAEEQTEVQALPDEEEQRELASEETERVEEIAEDELRRAPQNLEAYLQQQLLTEDEVEKIRQLEDIEQRLASGQIDAEEAEGLRAELGEGAPHELRQRLRAAVDHSVHYLSAFEALRRLMPERESALKLLIRHRNQVSADAHAAVDLSYVTAALTQDEDLLESLAMLLQRGEKEVRMLAANMPPFRHIYTSGEKIGSFTVGEGFVDDLGNLEREAVSAQLNSEDGEARLKMAADIKCMVALLAMFLEPTTFHREVVRLRIMLRIERLYNGATEEREGRHRVQQFLSLRMARLYPELNDEDRTRIERDSRVLMGGKDAADEEAVEAEKEASKRVYRM